MDAKVQKIRGKALESSRKFGGEGKISYFCNSEQRSRVLQKRLTKQA
jgi:hypothetical protein